jgi:hypothetical protein
VEDLAKNVLTITLAFDNPQIKPLVCRDIVERFISSHSVVYFDFDLQFSSLLQNLDQVSYERIAHTGKLLVLQPTNSVPDLLEILATFKPPSGGVIVLDSLNTLQDLLTEGSSEKGSKVANQKTALIITLLQNYAQFLSKSLIIVNITKSRPKERIEKNSSDWEKKLVGGRMIKFKSDLIIFTRRSEQNPREIEIIVQESNKDILKDSARLENYLIWL